MMLIRCLALVLFVHCSLCLHAQAETLVLESPVTLTGTLLTQGPDIIKQTVWGVTVTTKNIKPTPFTNREILTELLARGLISQSITGWKLVYLATDAGEGGLYAKKADTAPVEVPADLLTLPAFGPSIKGSTEVAGPAGVSATGTHTIALATCQVKGIPVSGLASNNVQTVAIKADSQKVNAVITTYTFNGSTDRPFTQLIKGVFAIGTAKISGLAGLP
jgi:hypothetical protein